MTYHHCNVVFDSSKKITYSLTNVAHPAHSLTSTHESRNLISICTCVRAHDVAGSDGVEGNPFDTLSTHTHARVHWSRTDLYE